MEAAVSSIIRTAFSFFLLLIISMLFGRQINSHKNHFNMAMAITVGSIVANMGFNINLKFWPMAWSFFTLVIIYYLSVIASYRIPFLSKFLSGRPCIMIEDGKIHETNMAAAKYNENDLYQQLRGSGIFSLSDVKIAVLEPSGHLSVQKKAAGNRCFSIKVPDTVVEGLALPKELIRHGKPVFPPDSDNLEIWVKGVLGGAGKTFEDFNYAVISTDRRLFADINENITYSDFPRTSKNRQVPSPPLHKMKEDKL